MIPECQHIYETGRKCRRIPKRGDDLCPGHRPNPNRSFHDDPGFGRKLKAFAQQIGQLPLLGQLAMLQDALSAAQPMLDRVCARTNARAAYTPIARATIALAVVWDSLDEAQQQARTLQRKPLPVPSHSSPPTAPRIK